MNESKLKARLERALHRPIPWPEWEHLKRADLVGDYDRDELSWQEFHSLAKPELDRLQRFHADKKREESGASGPGDVLDAGTETNEVVASLGAYSKLSGRTAARSRALEALDRLRAPDLTWQRARIRTTVKPRGGVDGTSPQWVVFMGVEAWMPAEEVKEAYRETQRALLAELNPPKTGVRAFEVAEFVWEQERIHGTRPPWPVLLERWNERSADGAFESWRTLRTNFVRGARATPPRYLASEEQITKEVRSRDFEQVFEMWASSFRS